MSAFNFYAQASSFSYILGWQLQLRHQSNEFKQPTMSRQARVCVCVRVSAIRWGDHITGLYCTLASIQSRRKTHKISCSCGEALIQMEIKLVSSTPKCLQVYVRVFVNASVCLRVVAGGSSTAPSLSRHLSAFPCCQFNCNCNQCSRRARAQAWQEQRGK